MTEETTILAVLLSAPTLLLALAAFYVGRSLWIARHVWSECGADTKILYLLVAPPLTFAVDVLEVTDRLLWSRTEAKPARARARPRTRGPLRAKMALRSDG
ncbi:MAG: hypothetical protein AB7S70_12985 [Hyphomicrobium sp.]|uniref:hypothetical protein n=1 Tax=Hyphomicrobium sp. TaxID=82 RepID=UPI003D139E92